MSKEQIGTYSEQFGEKFQRHILSVAVRIPGFVIRYRSALHHTYFFSELERMVARSLLTHVDTHKRLPTQTTLTEDIRERVSVDSMPDIEKLLRQIYRDDVSDHQAVMGKAIDFGKQQAMCNAVVEAADLIERGERQDVMEVIHDAQLVGEDLLDIGIDYIEDDRHHWYEQNRIETTIPTGIAHLDFALQGGLGRGELGVILAPPKRGKSTVLINLGFGALRSIYRYNVVHYSCEMKDTKIVLRYDDRLAGPMRKLKSMGMRRYIELLNDRAKKYMFGRLFVKSYPTRSAGVSTLRSHLTILASQGIRPDVILVDYGDILKPERRLGEMRHEQAGIYEDLRALAGEFDAAVWTASQAPRGALEKEHIRMDDFAESFEKAAVMDAGIAFCQTRDEWFERVCRLFLMGVRDVEDGRTIMCDIRRDQCLIRSTSLRDSAMTKVADAEHLDRPEGGETPDAVMDEDDADKADVIETTRIGAAKVRQNVVAKARRKEATSNGRGKYRWKNDVPRKDFG